MYALNYVKAKSVKEAADFLAANPEAKLLSGGMTLIPTLKQRLAKPTHLVDIGQLAELRGIEAKGGKLVDRRRREAPRSRRPRRSWRRRSRRSRSWRA